MLNPSLCHYNDAFILVKDACMLVKDTMTINGYSEDRTTQAADELILILIFVIFYNLTVFTRHTDIFHFLQSYNFHKASLEYYRSKLINVMCTIA